MVDKKLKVPKVELKVADSFPSPGNFLKAALGVAILGIAINIFE